MGRAGPNTSAGLLHLRMVVVRMQRSRGGGQDPGQCPHGVGGNGSVSVTVAFHWPLPRGNGTRERASLSLEHQMSMVQHRAHVRSTKERSQLLIHFGHFDGSFLRSQKIGTLPVVTRIT